VTRTESMIQEIKRVLTEVLMKVEVPVTSNPLKLSVGQKALEQKLHANGQWILGI
jgi:hypothetical protein